MSSNAAPFEDHVHHNQEVDASLAEFLNNMSLTDQKVALHVMNDVETNNNHYNSNNSQQPQRLPVPSSTEFNQLSQIEREMALHDIHGVAGDPSESPLQIQNALSDMNGCIEGLRRNISNNTNTNGSSVYDFCESQNPQYVQDLKFRLLFLRSVGANLEPQLAAQRLMAFLEHKLQLFGPNLLCETITLSHLSKDDMDFMKKGAMQLVPARDRAGRAVIVIFPSLFEKSKTHENAVRKNKTNASKRNATV
jgi:hypothetical protein